MTQALGFLFHTLLAATPPALLLGGLYFGVRLRFFPFLHPVRVVRDLFFPARGENKNVDAPSSLRAAGMAMAGTIGVGNIAGVSLALLAGGAGAVFWMWVCAAAAMLLKYAEIVLAMDSRRPDGMGSYLGGTPYAMRASGMPMLGSLFAVLCLLYTFLIGGVVQANAVADCLRDAIGCPPLLAGALLLLLVLPVTLGGGQKIAALTAKLVPLMCGAYLLVTGAVIFTHAAVLPSVFARIMREAFSPAAAGGGVASFLFSRALRVGAARGLMSNEGGCGTAPMAHVTARETVPARQGLFGILEVFTDTVLICTLTALCVLCVFPTLPDGVGAMEMVRRSFASVCGNGAGIVLAAILFSFAYATILCEAYYAEVCLRYMFGGGRQIVFSLLFAASLLFGAWGAPALVWGLCDILLAVMTLLNLFFLVKKAGRVVTLTADGGYISRRIRHKSENSSENRSNRFSATPWGSRNDTSSSEAKTRSGRHPAAIRQSLK